MSFPHHTGAAAADWTDWFKIQIQTVEGVWHEMGQSHIVLFWQVETYR